MTSLSQQIRQKSDFNLALLPEMQRGLFFLELPLEALGQALREEIDQNPLLECEEGGAEPLFDLLDSYSEPYRPRIQTRDPLSSVEASLPLGLSLYDFLLQQARDTFEKEEELVIAQAIIGNLDGCGFFKLSLAELASFSGSDEKTASEVVKKIQQFDPAGIAASSLKECLLLQLKRAKKEDGLVFEIIERHFELLLESKFKTIGERLHVKASEVRKLVGKEIALLDFRPAASFSLGHYPEAKLTILPDLIIDYSEPRFFIQVNKEGLGQIKLNREMISALKSERLSSEVRAFFNEKIQSGKKLFRHLYEREQTLYRMGRRSQKSRESFCRRRAAGLLPGR